jgi:hypothetical protein
VAVSPQPREATISAYFVVELEITNRWSLPGGGRRHDRALWRPLPGPRRRNRTDRGRTGAQTHVILAFADKAAFKRWYDSPEYKKILPGRLDNSTGRAFIVEAAS